MDTNDWTVHVIKNSQEASWEIEKINYKDMVEKYSMPFEFPIALAMVTQNPQFALAVVNLVKDSKLIVTIAESKTTTITTVTQTYTEKVEKKVNGEFVEISNSEKEEQISTNTEVFYSTSVELTSAKTWILDMTMDLQFLESTDSNDQTEDGSDSTTYSWSEGYGEVIERVYKTNVKNITNITNIYQMWETGVPKVEGREERFINLIIRDSNVSSGVGLVEIAKNCHDAIANSHRFSYGPTSGGIPIDVNTDSYVDCSGYVSWVLYEAGYKDFEGGQHTSTTIPEYGIQKGWEQINNIADLQPGDICCYSGHVNIYIGTDENDKMLFYDCGNQNYIDAVEPITYQGMGSFRFALRPNDEIAQKLQAKTIQQLEEDLNTYIEGLNDAKYVISVKDLDKNSNSFTINDEKMKSEGLLKLFIMATVYNKYDELKNFEEEGTITASIGDMIERDDNIQTNNLLELLGKTKTSILGQIIGSEDNKEDNIKKGIEVVNEYLQSNGYNGTHIETQFSEDNLSQGDEQNYTTSTAVTTILSKIYNGNCVNSEYSEKMKQYLAQSQGNDLIPSTIDSAISVANKRGEQADVLQDAAIVSIENANYVVTIMAKDVSNKSTTADNIKNISSMIYEYFVANGKINNDKNKNDIEKELDYIIARYKVCYKVINVGYVCPLDELVEGSEMLFELLRSSDRTQKHEELMRYLLYLMTGDDYGVTDFDFEKFLGEDFSNAIGTQDAFLEYLKSWENDVIRKYVNGETSYSGYITKLITEDRTKYICYNDNDATRNYGYGVCHWTGSSWNNVESYSSVNVNIKDSKYNQVGTSTLDVEIVDQVMNMEVQSFRQYVESKIASAGIVLESYQIDALTAVAYQYGNIGNFCEMYKKYGNTDALKQNFKNASGRYNPFIKGPESNGRANANWTLFHTGKYMGSDGKEIVVNVDSDGQTIPGNIDTDGYTQKIAINGVYYTEYKQNAKVWANKSYNGGTIEGRGCGITSVAVIASGYGKSVTPPSLVSYTNRTIGGMKTALSGQGIQSTAVTCKNKQQTKNDIITHLKTGKPILVLIEGKPFSSGGHFMPVLGINSVNQVYVSNVYKSSNLKTGWTDIDVLVDAIMAHSDPTFLKVTSTPNKTASTSDGGSISPNTKTSSKGWVHPCPDYSRISSTPGGHDGYDFAAPKGTKIYAATSGTVQFMQAYTGGYLTSYGNYVKQTTSDNKTVIYAHMNSFVGVSLKIPSSKTKSQSGSSGSYVLSTRQVKK